MKEPQDKFESLLASLNPQQQEVVLYTSSPQIIVAGAGSGKTRVIMVKIAFYCYALNVNPEKILAITFTNKAAQELKDRLEILNLSGVNSGTFHAVCLKILQAHGNYIGVKKPVVYDEQDQAALIKECLAQLEIDDKRTSPGRVVEWISRKKDELEVPQPVAGTKDYKLHLVYELYQKKLDELNALDFGGLIMKAVELLTKYPDLRDYYQKSKYTHILVDEYQDTNTAQAVFLKLLAGDNRHLTVVGDPDQSIYSWRGANINNLLHFEQSYPTAKTFRLEQNYRSTQAILEASNGLILHNLQRKEKNLWSDKTDGEEIVYLKVESDRAEAKKVAEILIENNLDGIPYCDMAVFYRTHSLSRSLEEILLKRGVPYMIVGGLPFYQRKEIKDLLCYVRFIINPADRISFKRIINTPARKIGDKTLLKIESAVYSSGTDFYTLFKNNPGVEGISGHSRKVCDFFIYLIDKYRPKFESDEHWNTVVEELIEEINYISYIKNTNTDEKADVRIDNINTLVEAFAEYQAEHENASIYEFIDTLALRSSADDLNGKQDKVSLMTLHCAKGLEFKLVCLIGMEEKLLPYYKDIEDADEIEEERRLCYVGITRAKEKVYLLSASRRFTYSGPKYSLPSRFISEIPEEKLKANSRPQKNEPARYFNVNYYPKDNHFDMNEFMDEFSVGDCVYHYDYGKGVILGGTGYGKNKKLIIQFNGEQEPTVVMASYAGLSKLDEQ